MSGGPSASPARGHAALSSTTKASVRRGALEGRLLSRRFGLDALDAAERAALLASLDEAEREIDGGRGLSADDLRRDVRAWAGR